MGSSTRKWWVLSAVACGTFMATLDSSIVNIALPTLTGDFRATLTQVKWVVVVYLLVVTCLLLPFGRISDQFGRKRIFILGFAVFTVGSAGCGLASDLSWLVAARVLQAIGVCMLMANGPAIITATFPAQERGTALGTLAMVVSAGLLSGPSVGGLLISLVGWRSIFWINIPVGLLGILLAHRFFPEDKPAPKYAFDWAGTFCQTLLLCSFIVLFDPPNISVSGSIPFQVSRWAILVLTLALCLLFVRIEKDAEAPIFDLSLVRNRTFWSANLAGFLLFVAYSCVSVLTPFYLEQVLHFSTQKAGLVMTAIPLAIFLVAPWSGRLSDRIGSRELSFAGALVGALTLFVMSGAMGLSSGLDAHTTLNSLILGLAAIGLATGLFQSPNNNAIMGCVPVEKLGLASALLATVRNLGLVTGTGLATTLFSWEMKQSAGDHVSSLHTVFLISAGIGGGAMLSSLLKRRQIHGVGPQGKTTQR